MNASRAWLVAATVLLAHPVHAQARADFDALSEGFVGATLVTPAGTFRDLVLDAAGTLGPFAVDDGSATLAGLPRFSAPNVLSLGAFTPGPALASAPVKSFRIVLPHFASAIRIGLFLDSLPAGNVVDVQFFTNGQPGPVTTIAGTGASGWTAQTIEACGGSAVYDEVRFSGSGTVDGGRFHGAVDTFVMAVVECGAASHFCVPTPGSCPCGNDPPGGPQQSGCGNSLGQFGTLSMEGIPSIAVDEMIAHVSHVPPFSTGLLVQSRTAIPHVPFGDGSRCIGAPLTRLVRVQADGNGAVDYPHAGDTPLSLLGSIHGAGKGVILYQFVYRNQAAFCTSSTFNITNGCYLQWGF